jgi:hypothetical protein
VKSSILIVLFCWFLFPTHAQKPVSSLASVQFYGRITDRSLSDSSEKPLDSTRVEVWADDSLITTVFSDSKGKYKIVLPHYSRYKLKYGNEEYIQKVIELDASEFSDERGSAKLTINIDVALFKAENKSDFDFLEKNPLARGQYRKKDNQILWDKDYISMMTLLVNNAIYHTEK